MLSNSNSVRYNPIGESSAINRSNHIFNNLYNDQSSKDLSGLESIRHRNSNNNNNGSFSNNNSNRTLWKMGS